MSPLVRWLRGFVILAAGGLSSLVSPNGAESSLQFNCSLHLLLLLLACFALLFVAIPNCWNFLCYIRVCCCLFGFQVFGRVMRNVGSVAKDGNKIQIRPT